jgi:hypothetical protein
MESDDYQLYPPTLQYFNLNVFNSTNSSIEMRSDIGSQNITVTPKSGKDLYLPEVKKTPSMFYGNTSGLKIGDQYGTINYSAKAIGTELSDGVSTIIFTAKPTTTSECRFIYSNPVIIKQASGTVSIAGTGVTGTIYVNGLPSTSAETNEWNHYTIVLESPISIDSVNGTPIQIGNSSSTTGTFYIDNLCLLESKLTSDEALNYYNLFYSSYSKPVKDSSVLNINFYDKEVRHDNTEYELFPNQKSIKATVSLAATENYTLSSNQINYSEDIDLIEIDSTATLELARPVTVLLSNQTNSADRGVYNLSFSGGIATFTPNTSLEAADIQTGDLIYVQHGDENGKEFLQKKSDGTYDQVFLTNKIVAYKEPSTVDPE